jgi:DNA invertase Pin-like site-specific DNA recombinase
MEGGVAMLVGYMRVSTSEQNLSLQRDALEGAGCERLFEDTCSGAVADRPGLARALDNLRAGDALVVWKLDRIGRSLGPSSSWWPDCMPRRSASRCSPAASTQPAPRGG